MENEKQLSPQESIALIQAMIDKTKTNVANDAFYFLLWGWLTFTICIVQYILMVWIKYPYHYYAWFLIWIGVVVLVFRSLKKKENKKVVSYVDDSMQYLWTGMGITFFVMGWICAVNEWHNCFPIFIVLYAAGTFISGSLLKFKPFIAGGIFCWLIAPTSAYFSYENQILFTALALMISYIIPGHLLKMKYQKQNVQHILNDQ